MRGVTAAIIVLVSLGLPPPKALRFHHLHLTGGLEFYARLFEPATTRRVSVAGFDGVQSGTMLLLFGRPPTTAAVAEAPSAIWHFGWGDVRVGETYLRHAAGEVQWEPPLPAPKLHIHLQSPAPASAAAWYRDVLGAEVNISPGAAAGRSVASRPELRVAEAGVWFDEFAMLIHRTDEPLVSTQGQRADHIAFACESLEQLISELRGKGVTILAPISEFGGTRHALIQGPDHIAVELVEIERSPH